MVHTGFGLPDLRFPPPCIWDIHFLGCYATFIGCYRRLETTYRSHLAGSGMLYALLWNKYFVPKSRCFVWFQKSEDGLQVLTSPVKLSRLRLPHTTFPYFPRRINFYDPNGTDLAALALNEWISIFNQNVTKWFVFHCGKSTCLY
jgi:hypothetical protein